jgi:hypothetical protein
MRTSRLLACGFLTLTHDAGALPASASQHPQTTIATSVLPTADENETAGDEALDGETRPSAEPALVGEPTTTNPLPGHAIDPEVDRLARLAVSRPHVLDGAVGDVIVQVHGGVCTGTPITGTVYVATAAHCVLTPGGRVIERTVERDGVTYHSVGVLVDTNYADHPREQVDAAVIVMARAMPGASARVGSALPENGLVMLAGYQPVDRERKLLRARSHSDGALSPGATATQTYGREPAGCVESVRALRVSAARVTVPCGLVPGASGGGLFAEEHGELVLVGILSTVTADLSANGIVPLDSLRELLEHPDLYRHGFSAGNRHRDNPVVCGGQCGDSVPCLASHRSTSNHVGVSRPYWLPCTSSELFVPSLVSQDKVLGRVEIGRMRP